MRRNSKRTRETNERDRIGRDFGDLVGKDPRENAGGVAE